jgi:AraC family transcriptional regulator of adaptative response/methylated-DNA-[protein]-cysteine methyltransferase
MASNARAEALFWVLATRPGNQKQEEVIMQAQAGEATRTQAARERAVSARDTHAAHPGEIEFVIRESTPGPCMVARSAVGVCAVLLGNDAAALRAELEARFPNAIVKGGGGQLDAFADSVIRLVESPVTALDVPLDLRGTAFQRGVWQAVREIPPGSTASYTDIATRIGRPDAARAVAQACSANMLAVVIPCHRVVRSDGALSGYRWGLERKRMLLDREKAALQP